MEKCKIRHNKNLVKIFVENEFVHEYKYEKPLGILKGSVSIFRGSGSMDDVKIYDGERKLVYENDFSTETSYLKTFYPK